MVMSKRMKVIFTLSLLANIIFAGVGIGLFYKFCKDIPIAGDMSPEARSFVARTFQEGKEEVKPLFKDIKSQRAKVESIIMAEQFDKAAYDREVDAMLDVRDQISRHRAEVMGKALAQLSLEDRQKFAKRALDGLEGRGKPPHRKGHGDKPMKEGGQPPPLPPEDGR
jgi:uncharacterized membrane protein